MGKLLPALLKYLRQIWLYLLGTAADTAVRAAMAAPIAGACIYAWGVFLAAFFTGASGLGLFTVFSSNPLSGAPAATLYLLGQVFPMHFCVGLIAGYITFKMTVAKAAYVMNKYVRVLLGV